MPEQIDVNKVASKNPQIDLDEFKKGEEALKSLRDSGTVRRSSYGLGTPESKQEIRPTTPEEHTDSLPAFRKLR